jgi:hypothetical protein
MLSPFTTITLYINTPQVFLTTWSHQNLKSYRITLPKTFLQNYFPCGLGISALQLLPQLLVAGAASYNTAELFFNWILF